MRAEQRLWRTAEDDVLVLDGDPKAVSLAYGEDDEVDEADEKAASSALKQSRPAQDKQAPAPADKARKPASKK